MNFKASKCDKVCEVLQGTTPGPLLLRFASAASRTVYLEKQVSNKQLCWLPETWKRLRKLYIAEMLRRMGLLQAARREDQLASMLTSFSSNSTRSKATSLAAYEKLDGKRVLEICMSNPACYFLKSVTRCRQ